MPRNPSPLRVALVGAGRMGTYHARVLTQSPNTEVACIIDPVEATGRPLADQYGVGWRPELDDLGTVDAVVIACPTEHHVAWATRALDAGRPLLIEKPIAEQVDEVERLVMAARRTGVPFMSGLLERYNPALMTLFDIVEAPVHVSTVRHSPYVDRIAIGVAFDLLIHDVDLVLRLADQSPTEVKAQFAYVHPKSAPHSEDVAEASMTFGSGMVASLSASRVSQRKIRSLEVSELDRLIEIDLVRQDITVYRHVGADFLSGGQPGYRQQTVIDIPAIEYHQEPLAAQLDRFVAIIRGDFDATAELDTLMAPHRVVGQVIESARSAAT